MVDSLTLTVNSRLARWLLFHYSRQQALEELQVWEKPAICSLDEWLRQAWLQSWSDQYILTDLQSRHLWQKIIREDPSINSVNLLHIQGAASHASEAYQLIRKYRLPEDPAGFRNYTKETQTFRKWMSRYQKQLHEWGALDPSELMDAVSKRMKQGHIPLPGEIVFHGFDEITPQLRDWLDLLQSKNVNIVFKPFEPSTLIAEQLEDALIQKQADVQKYEDANEEATQCARWIRSIYQEGKTIGIVVPQLESYRGLLEREFKAELAPASVYPWVETPLPFNISLGTPLSHEPMIHSALLLLSQRSKRIPLITFSTLITSPFLKCREEEIIFRRELDWGLRGKGMTHVYLPQALTTEDKMRGPFLEGLLESIIKWVDETNFDFPSQWAQKISNLLKELEWPAGSGTLSGHQVQALESWKSSLNDLASLDRVLNRINRHQAVSHLTHIVGETLFQPQTHEEPIQVIGLLESAGMEFDHLWIMGCHAETLPPVPRPNPFLPFLTHQKPYQLPHSTAERELAFTEQTLYRLSHSCKHMIFSYPAWQGESEMVPSPLISGLVTKPHAIHNENSSRLGDHPEFSVSLESLHDFNAVPVAQDEITTIRGGTKIIKHQAVCPFQAFAVHRLNSEHKEFPELDMDERARGSLVHNILELFWKKVQTSERLHELYESNSLDQQIRESVAQGLEISKIDIYGQQSFFDLEKERLANLMRDWMELERQRPEFNISKLETKATLNLKGLQLNLFVDRIDESRNGELTIIDYKTGTNQNLKKWFGERIEEPQLPLYSLTLPADALAFAVINKRKSTYLGLSQENVIIPGVDININKKCPDINHWDELKDYWKSRLDRTAEEFLEGILKVDPLNENDTCKLCDQKTLCRRTELLSRFEGEDE